MKKVIWSDRDSLSANPDCICNETLQKHAQIKRDADQGIPLLI